MKLHVHLVEAGSSQLIIESQDGKSLKERTWFKNWGFFCEQSRAKYFKDNVLSRIFGLLFLQASETV